MLLLQELPTVVGLKPGSRVVIDTRRKDKKRIRQSSPRPTIESAFS
jgi:hypothetical protein